MSTKETTITRTERRVQAIVNDVVDIVTDFQLYCPKLPATGEALAAYYRSRRRGAVASQWSDESSQRIRFSS